MIPNTRWTPEDRHLLRVNGIVPVEVTKDKDYGPTCGLLAVLVGMTLTAYLLYQVVAWVML